MPGTEIRVVEADSGQEVADGELGLVLARGPGIMRGYLDDEAATAAAFRYGDGWFDTGDLGWRAPGVYTLMYLPMGIMSQQDLALCALSPHKTLCLFVGGRPTILAHTRYIAFDMILARD